RRSRRTHRRAEPDGPCRQDGRTAEPRRVPDLRRLRLDQWRDHRDGWRPGAGDGRQFLPVARLVRCRLDGGARCDQGAERKGPRRAGLGFIFPYEVRALLAYLFWREKTSHSAQQNKNHQGGNMSVSEGTANLADMVRARAKTRGNFTVFEFEGRHTSFAEFDIKTNRVANALRALGVKPGERIAYLGKNSDIYLELLLGAIKAKVVMAPVNWRLAGPEIGFIVEDCKAPVLFVGPEFVEQVRTIRTSRSARATSRSSFTPPAPQESRRARCCRTPTFST